MAVYTWVSQKMLQMVCWNVKQKEIICDKTKDQLHFPDFFKLVFFNLCIFSENTIEEGV